MVRRSFGGVLRLAPLGSRLLRNWRGPEGARASSGFARAHFGQVRYISQDTTSRHCASADDMPDFPLEVFNIGLGFWPRAAIVLAIMVAAYFLGRGLRLR